MDDIKHMATTEKELRQLLRDVEIFSRDIKMQFGIEKCKINGAHKRKFQMIYPHTNDGEAMIQAMDHHEM